MTADSASFSLPLWVMIVPVAVLVLFGVVVWLKGRPFAEGAVFRASRLSSGNRLLPTQVLITPTSVVQFTPGWIGKQEESIHMAHIASVKIQTGVLLSDVLIETSGGASPIRCHGHRKSDAVEMKRLIEQYQDRYYQSGTRPGPAGPDAPGR
ncbi:MAG: PH domain-containing protein [Acidobacteria bacterium]|nr:PH domain-containing protein [Acidobacteriota bacterium]